MLPILTADEFVAGVMSVLALKNERHFILTETELDSRFQKAFEELVANEQSLGVTTNFTFYVDPVHRDSACLRDTLLAAKEKDIIGLNNPTFRTFEIKLNNESAEEYLKESPLPRSFLEKIAANHFIGHA